VQKEPKKDEIIEIDPRLIDEPPILLHPDVPLTTLQELAQSIRVSGQRQAVEVRRVGERYQLIDGWVRVTAAKKFNLPTLKAIVRDMGDEEAYFACATANAHRLESDPIQEGELFSRLLLDHHKTLGEICDRFAKSETYVKTRLAVAALPDTLKNHVRNGRLTLGAALQITRFEDPDIQMRLGYHLVDKNMTIKEAEAFVDTVIHYWEEEQTLPPQEIIDQAAIEPKFHCEYCDEYTTYGAVKTLSLCKPCSKHLEYLFEKERLEHTPRPDNAKK
jgi:ParB family chromosome partitioning protein